MNASPPDANPGVESGTHSSNESSNESSAGQPPDESLAQIRSLLFANEQAQIAELRAHVLDTPTRTQDLAAALPLALTASHAESRKLAAALQAPVNECLRASVRDDPQPLVDALFPIIGPAIRKSIAEALRSFTESLNKTIEYSFSAKGLRWRLEAARSGVAFGEIVLKHTLRFRVDEVFLIHRATGLLIEHAAQDGVGDRDNDAVSGMLTAIQDFVHDAFRAQNRLQEVTLGESLLWLIHGPDAMLVCVIRGVPNASLRELLSEALERIQRDYRNELTSFQGDSAIFAGLKPELWSCLVSEQKHDSGVAPVAKPRSRVMPIVAGLLAACAGVGLAWWLWSAHAERSRIDDYVSQLRAKPGFVVNEVRKNGGHWLIRGLRDPLAGELLPDSAGIEPSRIHLEWTPYLSLDPVLVERRAISQMRLPGTVRASLENGVLVLRGEASSTWIASLQASLLLPVGVSRIDLSQIKVR